MNLVIDNGNTSVKLGLFEQGQVIHVAAFQPDDIASLLNITANRQVDAGILSSVSSVNESLRTYLESLPFFLELDADTPVPVQNDYKTPETLGSDRLANAVAAYNMFKNENVLVLDAGTCLKFDFVDADGNYLGGAISPGLYMRYQALNKFTDRLPLLGPGRNPPLIGYDTLSSIQSGVLNGMLAEMDGIIDQYEMKYNSLRCILTGGDHRYFLNRLKSRIFAAPSLTLEGLDSILRYNQ